MQPVEPDFKDDPCAGGRELVWVEPESFDDRGGWGVDQQVMDLRHDGGGRRAGGSLCIWHSVTPRDVYREHLGELKDLLG